MDENMITFEDFKKLGIRIGTIVEAERIEGSEKLLKLQIDLGEEKRRVIAGVGKRYEPQDLVGRQIPVLINLEPKMIMGLESQGMILAAGDGEMIALLQPDKQVENGAKVK